MHVALSISPNQKELDWSSSATLGIQHYDITANSALDK